MLKSVIINRPFIVYILFILCVRYLIIYLFILQDYCEFIVYIR